jgi:hypothetical protein
MSIAGYLSAGRKVSLRMTQQGSDALGIRFEGAVMTGQITVEEGMLRDAFASAPACTGTEADTAGRTSILSSSFPVPTSRPSR